MNNGPRYSIIVPTHNGGKYLPACVDTIVMQKYENYELIISDDHSTDSTRNYLESLKDEKQIKVVFPEMPLSMTEHWEWALSHATGEWIIFVGQDDGLQPYFFDLADNLIPLAEERGIRTIMSRRAYFFWEGSEFRHGDVAVSYSASNTTRILNSKYEALKALLGVQLYFELPEMYTTSIFHKSILDEARGIQGGKVLTCHPQDANLAAIACSLDSEYLRTEIPLGWVGTSPKSAGLAISSAVGKYGAHSDELRQLREEYRGKVKSSDLGYHPLAGDFSFGDISVYFWQTLIKTPRLRSDILNAFLVFKPFKYVFFSSVLSRLLTKGIYLEKREIFEKLLAINNCSITVIWLIGLPLVPISLIGKSTARFKRLLLKLMGVSDRLFLRRSINPDISIQKASHLTLRLYETNLRGKVN